MQAYADQQGQGSMKLAKTTGSTTQGDFSAPITVAVGSTGARPAAITLISSGVSVASARQAPASGRGHQRQSAFCMAVLCRLAICV